MIMRKRNGGLTRGLLMWFVNYINVGLLNVFSRYKKPIKSVVNLKLIALEIGIFSSVEVNF